MSALDCTWSDIKVYGAPDTPSANWSDLYYIASVEIAHEQSGLVGLEPVTVFVVMGMVLEFHNEKCSAYVRGVFLRLHTEAMAIEFLLLMLHGQFLRIGM